MEKAVGILGLGCYVPEKVLTNHDLEKIVETSDEWIVERTGIKNRHIAAEGEATSDMSVIAAERALADAGVSPEEIELVIVATASADHAFPSTACLVQDRIGAKNAAAFDLSAGCSGFVYSLGVASQMVKSGLYKKALIIGAETLSRIMNWEDRNTCVLFGDGAGAVVLGEGDNYLDSVFHVKGGDNVIDIPQLIGKSPFYEGEQKKPYIHMRGQDTFKFAVNAICHDTKYLLKQNGLTFEDIKYIVPHQANQRIIDFASVMLKVPKEKFYVNIDRYGNTSSASIPIALDEMNRKGMLQKGDLLLLPAFGGGLASAACIVRW